VIVLRLAARVVLAIVSAVTVCVGAIALRLRRVRDKGVGVVGSMYEDPEEGEPELDGSRRDDISIRGVRASVSGGELAGVSFTTYCLDVRDDACRTEVRAEVRVLRRLEEVMADLGGVITCVSEERIRTTISMVVDADLPITGGKVRNELLNADGPTLSISSGGSLAS